jgi:hypothetical protein
VFRYLPSTHDDVMVAREDDVIGNLLLSAQLVFKVKSPQPSTNKSQLISLLGRVQGLSFS